MATAHKNSMRGLSVFITEIRNSTSKEDEEKKVSKELAKIRKKFKEAKDVDGYDRRKYVCKLVYIYLLGYDIDVGHMEALALVSSFKFQEKLIGYLALSLFLNDSHSMLPLLIQQLQNDLNARNDFHQALALIAIGNIGGKEMAEAIAPIVQKMLLSKSSRPSIKKKACMALLRLARKFPEIMTPDTWPEKIGQLLDEADVGLLTAVLSLLLGLAIANPKPYEVTIKRVIPILSKIVISRECLPDYWYYNMANPWLQVRVLRFLQLYGPAEDKNLRNKLNEILKKILASADVAKGQTVNHKNALNAVLFEAIQLIIHLDDDRELTQQAGALLGRFISVKETNVRYLALEAMGRFAALDNETASIAKKHQETIIMALKDPDISIRKRALDLLYGLCDRSNSKQIVSELLNYLATADYGIREDLVLKIAILAEKFAVHYSWYVDVILQLISLAGDFVSDEIWYRVVQIVTNHEDIQEYAAKTVFQALQRPDCHETAVKVGGYILGEFGHLIADQPNSSPRQQFELLNSKFATSTSATKALLLSTYIKFMNPYRELTESIRNVFKQQSSSIDTEIQQRACEYLKLSHAAAELLQSVWDVMPAFPDRRNVYSESDGIDKGSSASSSLVDLPVQDTSASNQLTKKNDSMKELNDIFSSSSNSSNSPSLSAISVDSVRSTDSVGTAATATSGSLSEQEITQFFKKSSMYPDGILYQDEFIRIAFKAEFSKGYARLALFYFNLTNQPITGFRTFIPPVPYLTINASPVGTVIEPRSQLSQFLQVACTAPFVDPPVIQVFVVINGKSNTINIKLPLWLARFVEGMDLNGPEFFQQWRNITAGPPLEQQAVIKAPGPIDMTALTPIFANVFHFTLLKGIDPNVNNLTGAGLLHTTAGQIVCLVRIETNPTALLYRVTIRTSNGTVSAALKEAFTSQLS